MGDPTEARASRPDPDDADDWGTFDADDDLDIDLACSSCNADLLDSELYRVYRVCPSCRRHFWMPARERIALLTDPGSFAETNAAIASVDPLLFHDRLPVPDRIAEAREQGGVADAVATGTAAIGGESVVLAALDLAVIGSGIGIVAGEKIALAMDLANARRLPFVAICSGGTARAREGVLSLAQTGKLALAASRLHRSGVPMLAVLTHPTTGNVYVGLANQADLLIAEPGSQVGLSPAGAPVAETLVDQGAVDDVVDRANLRDYLATTLNLLAQRGAPRPVPAASAAPTQGARAWQEVALATHADRPPGRDYVARLTSTFVEVRGDRVSGDDPGIVCGFGRLDGVSIALVAYQRGAGAPSPAGFRKISRLIRLAAHLELPVVALVDAPTPLDDGAPVALALSQTLGIVAAAPVPVVTAITGEVAGLSGMALAAGDRVLMQEHAVIALSAGEPVASARECLRLGLIDAIVAEPIPGAHANPADAALSLRVAIVNALAELAGVGPRRLLDERQRRLRRLGLSTVGGREVARSEVRELQEVQRLVRASFEDLRHRWEQRQLGLPNLPTRSTLPQFGGRPSITLPRINLRRPDLGDLASRVAATRRGTARDAPPDAQDEP